MAKRGSSAINERAINFAENRTFRSFVLLYTGMSLAILVLLGVLHYRTSKTEMLASHRLAMQLEGESYLPRLIRWMQGDRPVFPKDPAYETAFYLGQKRLGGTLMQAPEDFTPGIHAQRGSVYLVIPMGSYGLKDGTTVMMTVDDGLWRQRFWKHAVGYGSALFAVLLLIGIGLLRLFLRPMQGAVALLDRFIKDTTHELNTPVTAILTNIERLDTSVMDAKQRKKIGRIETAARTIGSIYDDLTFLLLQKEVRVEDADVDMEALVKERLDYFHTRFEAKRLTCTLSVSDAFVVEMDRALAARMIDNLLSNAVKYSDTDTEVVIEIGQGRLTIVNRGAEIPESKLSLIFERYARADTHRGGFGIGLHVVAQIARQYGIAVEVASKEHQTRFSLIWSRYTPRSF